MSDQTKSSGSERRRGRPPATDSEITRRALIDSARTLFARQGFDGTSLSGVANEADLTPTAVYHYFTDKHRLYEAVVHETLETVWKGLLESVATEPDMEGRIEAFLTAADRYGSDRRLYSAFLISVPVEAKRHPEFASLLAELGSWQSKVFDSIAAAGRSSGALDSFASQQDASDAIRLVLLGWSYETHYQPTLRAERADAVRAAIKGWSNTK